MKLLCLRLEYKAYYKEEGKLNLICKFGPNRTNGFLEIAVERFFVYYCFYQYIDKVNEENLQKVVMNM